MINYNEFDVLEKLNQIEDSIEERITTDTLGQLACYSKCSNPEVRSRVAQLLVFFPIESYESILLTLSDDTDELVRVNACDSLCNSKSLQTLTFLKQKARKDSLLVREYAIMSIADIAVNAKMDPQETIDFLQSELEKATGSHMKITCYRALCILGRSEYYAYLLKELNNRYYQNRCAVINALRGLVNETNKEQTKKALVKRLRLEKTAAVASNMKRFLEELR